MAGLVLPLALLAAGPISSLPVMLLAGFVLLTIALAVLIWTRWGQARPLAKCAALSLFAHLLLFCYAYTTRVLFDSPGRETNGVLQVRLSDPSDDEDAAPDASADKPWDQLPQEHAVIPPEESPERAADVPLPNQAQTKPEPAIELQHPAKLPLANHAPPLLKVPAPEIPKPAEPAPIETPQPDELRPLPEAESIAADDAAGALSPSESSAGLPPEALATAEPPPPASEPPTTAEVGAPRPAPP